MSLRETSLTLRLLAVCLFAAAAAGCQFQPMYAQTPLFGSGPSLRDTLKDVDVASIDGRIGSELRNDLIFELTGGSGNQPNAPYRLTMVVTTNAVNPIVDVTSGRPETEIISFDVTYKLHDVVRDRNVLTEKALARVTLDRGPQRFARVRAQRDAENRAAKVVAEQIRARLATFFLTRT